MTRLRAWLLALVLLWAQLAAGVHALEHLHDADDSDHPPCEWCLAFHAVQHGASGSSLALPASDRTTKTLPPTHIGARSPFCPHYQSRAPPLNLV